MQEIARRQSRRTRGQQPELQPGGPGALVANDGAAADAAAMAAAGDDTEEEGNNDDNAVNAVLFSVVKLRRGSGKDWQGMEVKAKGLKA